MRGDYSGQQGRASRGRGDRASRPAWALGARHTHTPGRPSAVLPTSVLLRRTQIWGRVVELQPPAAREFGRGGDCGKRLRPVRIDPPHRTRCGAVRGHHRRPQNRILGADGESPAAALCPQVLRGGQRPREANLAAISACASRRGRNAARARAGKDDYSEEGGAPPCPPRPRRGVVLHLLQGDCGRCAELKKIRV